MDETAEHLDAILPLLRSSELDVVEQAVELVCASGPALRDALLERGVLPPRTAVKLALRCGGACPPWLRLDLPFNTADLPALQDHPEVEGVHLSAWRAPALQLPPMPSVVSLVVQGGNTVPLAVDNASFGLGALRTLELCRAHFLAPVDLPRLQTLRLKSCAGGSLALISAPMLSSLQAVSVSSVSSVDLRPTPRLRTLHLESVGITETPQGMCAAPLETLNLSGNRIDALPDEIGQLQLLRELTLSSNPLRQLPDSLGELGQLRTLKLSACPLQSLPETMGGLSSLRALSVSHTALAALPASLSSLGRLQRLDLSGTRVASLPREGLPSVRTLNISRAPLALPPHALLPRLRQLVVSSAQEEAARRWSAACARRINVQVG